MYSILGYATNCHSPLGNNLVQIHRQHNILWHYIRLFQWSDLEYPYECTLKWKRNIWVDVEWKTQMVQRV